MSGEVDEVGQAILEKLGVVDIMWYEAFVRRRRVGNDHGA